jgi:hypothetical protein
MRALVFLPIALLAAQSTAVAKPDPPLPISLIASRAVPEMPVVCVADIGLSTITQLDDLLEGAGIRSIGAPFTWRGLPRTGGGPLSCVQTPALETVAPPLLSKMLPAVDGLEATCTSGVLMACSIALHLEADRRGWHELGTVRFQSVRLDGEAAIRLLLPVIPPTASVEQAASLSAYQAALREARLSDLEIAELDRLLRDFGFRLKRERIAAWDAKRPVGMDQLVSALRLAIAERLPPPSRSDHFLAVLSEERTAILLGWLGDRALPRGLQTSVAARYVRTE